jgi:hypothetical protein
MDGSRRHLPAVGQPGKAAPRPLFGQQLDQQIKRVRWTQQHQQQETKELGGTPARPPSLAAMGRQQAVDEIVRDKVGELRQQRRSAGGRQGSIHGAKDYRSGTGKSAPRTPIGFFPHSSHPLKCLQPISEYPLEGLKG